MLPALSGSPIGLGTPGEVSHVLQAKYLTFCVSFLLAIEVLVAACSHRYEITKESKAQDLRIQIDSQSTMPSTCVMEGNLPL